MSELSLKNTPSVPHSPTHAPILAPESGCTFAMESEAVLKALRMAVASVLTEIGKFRQPADIQKTFEIDRNLARQLFHLASMAVPISNGSIIPSRTSIDSFLRAAQARGAPSARVQAVNEAYHAFEKLVELHAGDRTTFNSMVSAATGIDDEWFAVDLQHRRNVFRALSHALGVQAKMRLQSIIIHANPDGQTYDSVGIGGVIGLRVLRPLPHVHIFGTFVDDLESSNKSSCEPLQLSPIGSGYIMEQFSSSPLPALQIRDTKTDQGLRRAITLEKPRVGNFGATTLFFGLVLRNLALTNMEPIYVTHQLPIETLMVDVLTSPGLRPHGIATGGALLGWKNQLVDDPVKLEGSFDVQYMGRGPSALATLEVPRYPDLLDATATKLQWNLQQYDAWRVRVEFPLQASTITIQWPPHAPHP